MPPPRSLLLPLLLAYKALRTPVAFGVSAIAENCEGGVLLVRQRYSWGWHLPGGGVERGEPPAAAIIRELQEEVGLQSAGVPRLHGIYTRAVGIATNVVALYRVADASISFRPNTEISAITWALPRKPPADSTPATLRRLAELHNDAPQTPYW